MGWFLLGNLAMETFKVTNIQYTAPASEREKNIGSFETWLSFSQMCPRWGPFVSLTIDQLYWSEWFELEQEIKVSSLGRFLRKYFALLPIGWAVSRHLVKSWSNAFSAGKYAPVFTSDRSAIRQLAIVWRLQTFRAQFGGTGHNFSKKLKNTDLDCSWLWTFF